MSQLDREIRQALERLSEPTEGSEPLTFDRLVARRRRRRIRNTVLVMLPIVVLLGAVGGLMSYGSDDGTTVIADGDRDRSSQPAASPTVSVERIEVVGGDGGTARVVMEFDGPLPGRNIRYVDDLTSVDAGDEIVYTTQEAASVHVCASVHSFPPPAEGTVDLLIPADWFAQGEDTHTGALETIAEPAKFIVCGPHNGFFQYSIWGPVSADVSDVNITVDPDGRRLTVQIDSTATEPPKIDQDEAEAAELVVSAFLDDLRSGDLAAAADRWTGYPELLHDAPPAEKAPFMEGLLADPRITRILEGNTETYVTASWGRTTANPVVTVLAPRDGDEPPVAFAFLTGFSQEQGEPEVMWIQRLPQTVESTTPDVTGSFIEPGQQVVIPGTPVEGGARAYINSREIAIDVDYVNLTMTITLSEDVEGDVAITLSAAGPELPDAHALALTIGSP